MTHTTIEKSYPFHVNELKRSEFLEVGGMVASISDKSKIVVRKWVNLGGMSGCFGAVVGAPRVGEGEITLPSGGLVGRIQKFCTA